MDICTVSANTVHKKVIARKTGSQMCARNVIKVVDEKCNSKAV